MTENVTCPTCDEPADSPIYCVHQAEVFIRAKDATPNNDLQVLVEKWRRIAKQGEADGHNDDVDKGLQRALEECANELEQMVDDTNEQN